MVDKFDYSNARNVAAKLIDKFGESGSFVAAGTGSGGYDDFGNTGNTIVPSSYMVINGIITPLLSYKQSEIDGEAIQQGDGYVFFHSDTAPPVGATTTLNGLVYRAVWAESLDSVAGVNVFRKVQLRR